MDEQSPSTPISTEASPSSQNSSSEPLTTSPPAPSDSEAYQITSVPQEQPLTSTRATRVEEEGKDDDVEGPGSTSVLTAQDKGKGRVTEDDSKEIRGGPEDLARALAGFKIPEQEAGENQGSKQELSESHVTISSQNPNPPSLPDRPAQAPAKPEEAEEEWLLKSIAWPPLPPRPASSQGGGFETCETLRVKIVQQNQNGPCSLIALCNILILRNDLEIAPGRDRVNYSYLSTLLANYFLQVTSSSSSIPPSPALTHLPSTRQFSLEAALSILPQTRYGLNLNPQFTRVDGFTSSPSSGEGELALFSLAQIPLLHGWLGDPADEETYKVLEEAGDYDRAVEIMVEGSEVAGKLGLEGSGGVDFSDEELIREAERRSQWTNEEEEKVRKAHLINLFLNATSTQLTYTGLFALSSTSSLLPPAGLAACFRNGHLSVLYRRPRTPTNSSERSLSPGPELFTLVTDSSFAGEEQIVWESIEDVDGSASEFFTAGLDRSRTKGGDWAGVRNVADLPEHARRNEGNELADLALAQQLQAEEEDRADAYERAEQRRYEESQRSKEPRPDSSPTNTSNRRTSHSATAGGRRGGQGGNDSSGLKGSKSKAEKDKCLVM